MIGSLSSAPRPSYRLIPSQFPPIGLFDTIATAADAVAVMELTGWTNDRQVNDRITRLPEDLWVYGRPNSSVIMGSFLHVAPGGMRFNRAELGAWYAATEIQTAIAEVAHHLRRDAIASHAPSMSRTYRTYSSALAGDEYRDIRGLSAAQPEIYRSEAYSAAQDFGESVRSAGQCGIIYDSLRRRNGINLVAFIPPNITDVMQTEHFEISVESTVREILVRRLTLKPPIRKKNQ